MPVPFLQPSLVHAVLAVLPPTVRQLRLHVDCYGPLFTVLQRMPQLDSFSIGGTWGNGAHLQWGSPAATAAVRKLTSLRLNFREAPEWDGEFHLEAEILPVPDALPCVLAAATRLTSLELLVKWQGGVAQLCAALPALQDLRWDWTAGWIVSYSTAFIASRLSSPPPAASPAAG